MKFAQQAHIAAFALNMAYGDPTNEPSLVQVFDAANIMGFQLFFSFDYAGNGAWPKSTVIDYLTQYGSNAAHHHYQGKPFVSTFEGAASAADWIDIKTETGCYFVPDWSSLGAKAALEVSPGVPDGLFSWAGWPWGPNDMDTYVDASYMQYLDGKPYMMPVSPWFYTNLHGYKKNWVWNGDHLWYERWGQVLYLLPEWHARPVPAEMTDHPAAVRPTPRIQQTNVLSAIRICRATTRAPAGMGTSRCGIPSRGRSTAIGLRARPETACPTARRTRWTISTTPWMPLTVTTLVRTAA
jgi:hypothetical protein